MLLRIDVFPDKHKITERDEDGFPVSSVAPLYACLATAKPETGEIFTLGRKESDVLLMDKSVSRRHLALSLISTQDAIEDRANVSPKTPEENAACEADPDGCCIVVKDSSKFGTFLVKEGTGVPNDEKDDKQVTDGSDTEDESQKPSAAGDAGLSLSPVTCMLTNSKAHLQRLESNSTLVLPELKDRVIIQCGQNGSTLVIRRVPLNIVWSRLDKSTRDLWTKRLPALGASLLKVPDDSMTHLITDERVSNAKNLMAWYMRKQPATTEYLQALWDRRSPKDPMPKESDCAPTVGKEEAFWQQEPNPRLFAGCTFLCLLNDDFHPLIRVAGAHVVTLFDVSEKEAIKRLKEMDLTHAFYIGTNTKKVAKIVRHLQKENVAHVTQKAVGHSVAKQLPLEDHHHNIIGPPPPPPPPEEQEEEEEPVSQASIVPPSVEKQPAVPSKRAAFESTSKDTLDQSAGMEQAATTKESVKEPTQSRQKRSNEASQEESEEAEQAPKKRRKTSSSDEPPEEKEETTAAAKTASSCSQKESEDSSSRKKKRANEASQDEPAEEEPPKQRRKTSEDEEPMPPIEEEEEEEDQSGWHEGDEPKKLEVSNDGWFVAAPRGNKRKAYLRQIDVQFDNDGDPPPPTADTKACANLVVGRNKALNRRAQSMGRRGGGKNFKKFRKNTIIKGAMSRIELRSVLPKESEAEVSLDEQERAFEEEQRVADALFRDTGGGIRSHFKTKKRKR